MDLLPFTPEQEAIAVVASIILLLVAAALEAFWDFGRQVRVDLRPDFFNNQWARMLLPGWVLVFLIAAVLLFGTYPQAGLVAIIIYWLLLPLVVGPRVRKRVLPDWSMLRKELEPQGYSERTYWRRGDWWKEKRKEKPESKPEPESEN